MMEEETLKRERNKNQKRMEEESEWKRNAGEVDQRDRVAVTTTLRKKEEKSMITAQFSRE